MGLVGRSEGEERAGREGERAVARRPLFMGGEADWSASCRVISSQCAASPPPL
jgi:hypothetical protein